MRSIRCAGFAQGWGRIALLSGVVLAVLVVMTGAGVAQSLTLDQALDIALNRTMRGEMIDGNLDVAQQLYSARRINMYLPEISINGSVPSYRKAKEYKPYDSPNDRELFETRNLNFSSFIELKQSLFTGGQLTAKTDLTSDDDRRPDIRYEADANLFVDQLSKQGSFSLNLDQPLFRPSSVKNELHNRKDDLETAKVTQVEETAALQKEVTEAYVGTMQQQLKTEMAAAELKRSQLQQAIDSSKLADEVLSQEDFLLSRSSLLDAQLAHRSAENELGETQRELATLLDIDVTEELSLAEPVVVANIDASVRDRMVREWELAAPIKKAEHKLAKAEREADYASAGHGLTGDLKASYSYGRQEIESDKLYDPTNERDPGGFTSDDIPTSNWTIALNFKLPLWDGGAGSAAVQAARYQAEQARYEFTRAKRSARAAIVNLVNQLDVSYQRLDIIRQQIDLAEERLSIAEGRFEEGRISESTLLESRIFLLETREGYFAELKKYLLNRIDLESQYLD